MPAPTRQLLTYFDTAHKDATGHRALIAGAKHGMMLARVWRLYGDDTYRLMDLFFAGNDFADEAGYSVGVFVSQVPRLLLRLGRQRARVGSEAYYAVAQAWMDECEAHHAGSMCANRREHERRMGR